MRRICKKLETPFGIKRNDVPIELHPLKNPGKSPNITARNGSIGLFSQYQAAVSCGATLEELFKLRQGLYPKWFVGELIAFYQLSIDVRNHGDDSNYVKPKGAKKG